MLLLALMVSGVLILCLWLAVQSALKQLNITEPYNERNPTRSSVRHFKYYQPPRVICGGDAAFAAALDDIRNAERYVWLEYYIFDDDSVGRSFARELTECVARGVDVRILADGYGCLRSRFTVLRELCASGVKVVYYRPLSALNINRRNHRKIIIADGIVAYTGGINIAERYRGKGTSVLWRDTCIRVCGGAAAELGRIFRKDWHRAASGEITMDAVAVVADSAIRIVADKVGLRRMFFDIIGCAERELLLSTPYFVPPALLIDALVKAVDRGVSVIVLLPRRSDGRVVGWASEQYVERLLRAGAEVWLYGVGFNHSKTLTADSCVTVVGTANFDRRSFESNDEVAAEVFYSDTVQSVRRDFFDALNGSYRLTLDEWLGRPVYHKIAAWLTGPLHPLL